MLKTSRGTQRWLLCCCLWLSMASAANATSGKEVGLGGLVTGTTTTTTTQNALLAAGKQQQQQQENKQLPVCSRMLRHVFENATPRDEQQAGIFVEYKPEMGQVLDEETYLWNCLEACCDKSQSQSLSLSQSQNQTQQQQQGNACNVVLVFKSKCYHIHCVSNEACLPKPLSRERDNDKVQMVLVNPVGADQSDSWTQLLKSTKQQMEILPYSDSAALNFWKQPRRLAFQVNLL